MNVSFGRLSDGREARLFLLRNRNGMEIALTDFGAALVKVLFADKDGIVRDLVLGYEDAEGYEKGTESLGATVGRVANRIGQGRFVVSGKSFQLFVNCGAHTLHGGKDFYVHRLWALEKESDASVTFALNSEDGDQGFPGNVRITVTYTLTDDNEIHIDYHAVSDADTPLNLTNHSYFNLGGHDSGLVLSQKAMIHSDRITKTDQDSLPTGKFMEVEGTPMDFRRPKALGKDISENFAPLVIGNGYDHNYVIIGSGYREAATLYCENTGIFMTVKTDLPGIQLYTANYLDREPGKGGVIYKARQGVCFETQFYPDAVNKEHFPGGVLKAGEEYVSRTSYGFHLK